LEVEMFRVRTAIILIAGALAGFLLIGGSGIWHGTASTAPIFGESPRTQFFLGTAFRTFGWYQKFEDDDRELRVWTAPAIFSYAPITDASLTLAVPYVDKQLKTPAGTENASGLGDIRLQGKYRFYRRDLPFGRDQLAIIGGVEFPTGSTSEGPGIKDAPALQLGSGGVDGIVGLAAGTTRSWYSIEASFRWKINSEAKDVEFGDVLLYDLYLAYQAYPEWPTPLAQFNLSVELNGRTSYDIKIDGRNVNTGGTVLFVSPGIQYILTENLLVESGVQIPVVKNFSNRALEPEVTVLFGLRYIF
jgi:hypothetical protein